MTLLACAALVVAFLLQGLAFVRNNSQTFDEAGHIAAGASFLARFDFRLYQEHPPLIRTLCALPLAYGHRLPFAPDPALWDKAEMWSIGQDYLHRSSLPPIDILTAARLPNLFLGALLVALVGWWAYRLWGLRAAVVATALAAFEPNLVAHASLVGTDLGITLFTFLSVYLLWEYAATRRRALVTFAGFSVGLALTAKFSGLMTYAICLLLIGLHIVSDVKASWGRRLGQAAALAIMLSVAAAVVFPAVYMGTSVKPWLDGLLWQMSKLGHGHASFFLGDYSDRGWWLYFPVAFAAKTPLGTLALMVVGLLLVRLGEPLRRREALFLLVPVVAFVVAVVRGRVDVGVRYLLPIYPFLIVAAARLATAANGRVGATMLTVLVSLNAASVLRMAPHHLAYFNEAAGGPANGARLLGDSNIDWGQGLVALNDYLKTQDVERVTLSYFGTARPEGYGIRSREAPACSPVVWPARPLEPPGDEGRTLFAISVTCLQGTYFDDKTTYHWLWEREPLARVGGCIYVYDLTGDADARRRLAEVYERQRGERK